jgi:general secretion pathway protein J
MMNHPQKQAVVLLTFIQGFTLLELLTALAIFALIATLAYRGLNTLLTIRQQTDEHAQKLAQLQTAFTQLGRDIEQYRERQIRDHYGDIQPALQGTDTDLEFTHTGWNNPAQQQRSTLQRVAYHLKDKTLWRTYWRVLDRAQDSPPLTTALLDPIETLYWRYLDNTLQWQDKWPPSSPSTTPHLPTLSAIEITLTLPGWGQLRRLYRVPNS